MTVGGLDQKSLLHTNQGSNIICQRMFPFDDQQLALQDLCCLQLLPLLQLLSTGQKRSCVLCRITSAPLQEISTEKKVTDEEVKTLLATSLKSKKKNKKKKSAKVENGAKDVEAEQ